MPPDPPIDPDAPAEEETREFEREEDERMLERVAETDEPASSSPRS